MLLAIIGVLGAALLTGAVVYLAIKLTVSVLKSYRKKKTSKIMAAQVKDLIKQAPTMSLDDLEDDDIVLAEYDPEEDDLVQDITIAQDIDSKVANIVDGNGGIVVFD
ncbi:MAG: hypothetical protein PHY47_24205 [Lachnospiraceae bacterium]|nr:hypothetical protein [Lachnospiraceae bacterium]